MVVSAGTTIAVIAHHINQLLPISQLLLPIIEVIILEY
jgi:hypothetical protein